jgi:hypothetical protein
MLQNSTLVLTSENRTRDQHEPSGEPETLWGRMKGKMGDRALREKPPAEKERLEKQAKKKRQAQAQQQVMHPHVCPHPDSYFVTLAYAILLCP